MILSGFAKTVALILSSLSGSWNAILKRFLDCVLLEQLDEVRV